MTHIPLKFDNSYARLPGCFYQRIYPTPVKAPELVCLNESLATELGINLNDLPTDELPNIFAGNLILPGADPIALAYAGHQFGHFVPQLGDGRAILLGEVIDIHGKRQDIQLKGSGKTPFSRNGDGRAALGPVIREYILSEAMHALGVPTTRSLAIVKTGEPVFRETILPGAILTRVASSHVRIGTFEFFAARKETAMVKQLSDYVIERHYPHAKKATNPYHALLQTVIDSQAALVAKWLQIGFIHGVMNTDNTSIAGETIDYGPCAFMDEYDPATVFSAIDHYGRYAYGRQIEIAHWNLQRLAECLLPLLAEDLKQAITIAKETTESFPSLFKQHWLTGMCAKIGITKSHSTDLSLIQELLALMQTHHADYTLSFRYLHTGIDEKSNMTSLKALFSNSPVFEQWLIKWRKRLLQENIPVLEIARMMNCVNPAYIARNHLVGQATTAAVTHNDFSKMYRLISVLSRPYVEQPDNVEYLLPPTAEERVHQTFCGT